MVVKKKVRSKDYRSKDHFDMDSDKIIKEYIHEFLKYILIHA